MLQSNHLFDFLLDAVLFGYLVLHIQIDVLVNIHVVNGLGILCQSDELVNVLSGVVGAKMPLVLGQNLRLSLLTAEAVTKRSLNDLLIQDCTILKGDSERVGDGTLLGVMVVLGELGVLNTADLLAERLDESGLSGLAVIRVVGGLETVEHKHSRDHVLDAVVTIGKVLHGLELLVDDANAGLVSAVDDVLDVLGGLAHSLELLVEALSSLDGGLGVELG